MIEDSPLLTIRRNFARPPADQVAALADAPAAQVVDAQGGRGALDFQIKPLQPEDDELSRFCGVAMTCHCGPADNLALCAAQTVCQPGDVLMAATDSFTGTSIAGDLLVGMSKNRGVAALVTDGLVRDIDGIAGVGLPVFCSGVSPNSPVRNGPGTVGEPITIGGVTVSPGDVVVGDRDGVVVVSRDELETVLTRLQAVQQAEAALEQKVLQGMESPSFIAAVLESEKVHYLD
jgi:4-hydroxy-4-methyl-2-oxoglutarate aldolase